MKWTSLRGFFSPFPVACLRSKTAASRDRARKTGKNEGGRCMIKRMENQEARGLGKNLDLEIQQIWV